MTRWKSRLKYEAHDLNGDRIPEFFVYVDSPEWCGASAFNCAISVYQKRRKSYKLIVIGTALDVMKSSTNGYKDLESQHGMGGCTLKNGEMGKWVGVSVYKYNGRKYEQLDLGDQCRRQKRRQ